MFTFGLAVIVDSKPTAGELEEAALVGLAVGGTCNGRQVNALFQSLLLEQGYHFLLVHAGVGKMKTCHLRKFYSLSSKVGHNVEFDLVSALNIQRKH